MKNLSAIIAICVLIALLSNSNCEAKRGGFSGGFKSGGSRPSSSGGWSFGGSKPSPSYSRPSPSYSAPSYRPAPAPAPSYKPSAPSPSYGWNIPSSNTQPKPPAAAPSYGWNVGNTASKPATSNSAPAPSYGWNVGNNAKPSAPVGPPPSYPGMQNRPVPSNNAPPAYMPSNYNPPAYSPSYNKPSYSPSYPSPSFSPSYNKPSYSPSYPSPSNNNYRPSYQQPSHTSYHSPSYSSRPSYSGGGYYGNNNYNNNNGYPQNYGNTFGANGLPGNTYISNNYYGNQRGRGGGGSGFLTNALFFGGGLGGGYLLGSRNSDSSYRRRWDEEEDRKWRATTKAPYFENKVPGEDVILPASAVVGAATAFGLVSLLPLNVPSNKPLMYCNQNASDLAQTQIYMNGNVYLCINDTILISNFNCLKSIGNENITNSMNETTTTTTTTSTESSLNSTETSTQNAMASDSCNEANKIMHCDGDESIYCVNGTLLNRQDIFCNSTTLVNGTANLNQSILILNCYEGLLAEKQTGFIPTTTTTEAPVTTTEKSLSFTAKVHAFLLRMIGKGNAMEKPATTTTTTETPPEIPQQSIDESFPEWVPEALTIPPEVTTEAPTTPKMMWTRVKSNGEIIDSPDLQTDSMHSLLEAMYKINPNDPQLNIYGRVPVTTTTTTTEAAPTTTPKMVWVRRDNNIGSDPQSPAMQEMLEKLYSIDPNSASLVLYERVPASTVSTTEKPKTDN